MSFDRNNLERLGGGVAGANGCWIYSTDDAIDAVEASGYFDEAARELKEKDYIIAMANTISGTYRVSQIEPFVALIPVTLAPPTGIDPLFSEVTQPGHTFVPGNIIYYDNGTNVYDLAIANDPDKAKALGVVVTVAGDVFTYMKVGFIPFGGFTPGEQYYLSETTAGTFTTTPPSPPNFLVPIFQAHSPTSIFVNVQFGQSAGV